MPRQIGFANFEKAWQGPIYLEFTRYSDHTKTVRYRSQLETRAFDLYAPLFMLKELPGEQPPAKLIAAIGKGPERLNTIGFAAAPYKPRVASDVCEFILENEMVNSVRYDLTHERHVYSLYVPNEVFGDEPAPRLVYLRLGVP
jgi:hypothetical protein